MNIIILWWNIENGIKNSKIKIRIDKLDFLLYYIIVWLSKFRGELVMKDYVVRLSSLTLKNIKNVKLMRQR